MDSERIPKADFMKVGQFFTECYPVSLFTCLWRNLQEINITPEEIVEEWTMNFTLPNQLIGDKFLEGANKPDVTGPRVEIKISQVPEEEN